MKVVAKRGQSLIDIALMYSSIEALVDIAGANNLEVTHTFTSEAEVEVAIKKEASNTYSTGIL